MQKRVVSGVVAAAIFLPLLILGGIAFDVLVGLLAMVTIAELFKMKGLEIFSFEGVLAMLAAFVLTVPLGNYFTNLPLDASVSVYSLMVLFLLAGQVLNYPSYRLEDAVFPVATSFYVGFGFHQLLAARLAGVDKLLLALFIVWATDIGAYMLGMKFGKRKFAPQVSPNKTLEGFLGGMVSAVLVAVIFLLFKKETVAYPLYVTLPLVALFSGVAQLGDLVESAIKRQYGVKDSGKLIPGHGGIFDRFDSLIFVLPVMHLFGLF